MHPFIITGDATPVGKLPGVTRALMNKILVSTQNSGCSSVSEIDLLAIVRKSLDQISVILMHFIHKVRSSGVEASIAIVHIRKF